MHRSRVSAGGDVDSDPLVVAERDGVDGCLDRLEVTTARVVDEDAFSHRMCSVASVRCLGCEGYEECSNTNGYGQQSP